MNRENLGKQIAPFVPDAALNYVLDCIVKEPFHLRITEPRKSKKGDFRPNLEGGLHRLSVNGSMNRFEFLITFIHEYAHLLVWNAYQNKVKPHGKEWKYAFQKAMAPVLNESVFPESILGPLRHYMQNPAAASGGHLPLQRALMNFDAPDSTVILDELETGSAFSYEKKGHFIKMELRRTRIKCKSLKNGRFYLFSPLTPVEPLEAS